MNSPEVPYRLSIIGYWSDPEEPPEWSRGLPNPRDLRGEWDRAKRRKVLSHLRRGKVFRTFMGLSQCRMCSESLGCQELTDGQWAWPSGLDWVAANTPARPANYAVSLEEAQLISQGLSHDTWQASLEEVMGRWRLQITYEGLSGTIYLQKCPSRVLERRLLSLRVPDRNNILDASRADAIAKEYDGSWGAARILGVHPAAWYVWIKHPDGEWPESEQVNGLLQDEHQLGWITSHPDGSTSFITPPTDEHCWRWLLSCEEERSIQSLQGQGCSDPGEQIRQVFGQGRGSLSDAGRLLPDSSLNESRWVGTDLHPSSSLPSRTAEPQRGSTKSTV